MIVVCDTSILVSCVCTTAQTSPATVPSKPPAIPTISSSQSPTEASSLLPGHRDAPDTQQPWHTRRHVVAGFNATQQFLREYSRPERLFLFFVCSDDAGNALHWSPLCADAERTVTEAFARSPADARLLVVRAGSQAFWKSRNSFTTDHDLRLKAVPTLLKWEGNGRTTGMLNGASTGDPRLVGYLLRNRDVVDALPRITQRPAMIETVAGYAAFQQAMTHYRGAYPLYVLFVSGRIASNDRPWCPYCRFSDLPVEYAMLSFAVPSARLLRVEVTKTYPEWKSRANPFRTDALLGIQGVPKLYKVARDPVTAVLSYDLYHGRLDTLDELQAMLQQDAARWKTIQIGK